MHISFGTSQSLDTSPPPRTHRVAALQVDSVPAIEPRTSAGGEASGASPSDCIQPPETPLHVSKKQAARLHDFSQRLARTLSIIASAIRDHEATLTSLASHCEAIARQLISPRTTGADVPLLARGIRTAEAALEAMGGDRAYLKTKRVGFLRKRVVRTDGASFASLLLDELHRDETVLRNFLKKTNYPGDPFALPLDIPV